MLAYKCFCGFTNAISDRTFFTQFRAIISRAKKNRELCQKPGTAFAPHAHRMTPEKPSQPNNKSRFRMQKMKIEIWVKKTQPRDSSIKHIAFRDTSLSPGSDGPHFPFFFFETYADSGQLIAFRAGPSTVVYKSLTSRSRIGVKFTNEI